MLYLCDIDNQFVPGTFFYSFMFNSDIRKIKIWLAQSKEFIELIMKLNVAK